MRDPKHCFVTIVMIPDVLVFPHLVAHPTRSFKCTTFLACILLRQHLSIASAMNLPLGDCAWADWKGG